MWASELGGFQWPPWWNLPVCNSPWNCFFQVAGWTPSVFNSPLCIDLPLGIDLSLGIDRSLNNVGIPSFLGSQLNPPDQSTDFYNIPDLYFSNPTLNSIDRRIISLENSAFDINGLSQPSLFSTHTDRYFSEHSDYSRNTNFNRNPFKILESNDYTKFATATNRPKCLRMRRVKLYCELTYVEHYQIQALRFFCTHEAWRNCQNFPGTQIYC